MRFIGRNWITVLVLSLAIAANTICFSFLKNAIRLPFPNEEDLVAIGEREPTGAFRWALYGQFADELTSSVRGLKEAGAFLVLGADANVVDEGDRLWRLRLGVLSHDVVPMLGIRPILGRGFRAEEDQRGQQPVVLLSERLWKSEFAGDRGVLGRTVRLNHQAATIVGVLPDLPTSMLGDADLWTSKIGAVDETINAIRTTVLVRVAARLRPGVTLAQTNQELEAFESHLDVGRRMRLEAVRLGTVLFPESLAAAWLAFAITMCFASISALNFGVVILNRCLNRSREFSIRLVLGASVGSLARIVFGELMIVCAISVALAQIWHRLGSSALASLAGADLGAWSSSYFDWVTLAYLVGITTILAVLAFALPLLWIRREEFAESIRAQAPAGGLALAPLRKLGITLQVAVVALLLFALAAMIGSLNELRQVDLGFNAQATAIRIRLNPAVHDTAGKQAVLAERLIAGFRSEGRVVSVGVADALPFTHMQTDLPLQGIPVEATFVAGDYLEAMGIRVTGGRPIRSQREAMMDSRLARHFDGGRPFRVPWTSEEFQVVGEADRICFNHLNSKDTPQLYLPLSEAPAPASSLYVVFGSTSPLSWALQERLVRSADGGVLDVAPFPMQAKVDEWMKPRRTVFEMTLLFAGLGALAVGLGFGGAIGSTIVHHQKDLAIRLALGARLHQLAGPLWRNCGAPYVVGAVTGISAGPILLERFATQFTSHMVTAGIATLLGLLLMLIPLFGVPLALVVRTGTERLLRAD